MLPEVKINGTAKVINKGVDITLLTTEEDVEKAFYFSRILAVKGISAAVLQLTELKPVDTKTLKYYESTSDGFVSFQRAVYNAVFSVLGRNTKLCLLPKPGAVDDKVLLKNIINFRNQ